MLDSLVRVSRRVGWRADRFATDPVPAGPPRPSKEAVGRHGCPVSASRTSQESEAAYAGGGSSVPRRIGSGEAITVAAEAPTYLPRRLLTAREPVVALCLRKVHTAGRRRAPGECDHISDPTHAPAFRAESRRPTLRIHPFTSRRFHVLLNSLFKVLFNFPSRYLSAIGLVPVFSLRWSLPPALGCIPKQPDSGDARSRPTSSQQRPDTRSGRGPDQEDFGHRCGRQLTSHTPQFPPTKAGGFGAGLIPLHSPLLRESWLVSFPPLSDMLKFSG